MKYISITLTIWFVLLNVSFVTLQRSSRSKVEDAFLDFPALARKYGYKSQEYDVTTDDGYILKLFRIPGNKTKPVLLTHGFLDSADTYILRGRKALAPVLAEKGYDVWLGNFRGNKHSRRHEQMKPDIDKEFWNFSFHQMGAVDLPAFIDFILQENNVQNISLIGHSQGNTVFYVLGSTKPEYNEKINVAIALAPECYFNTENYDFPINSIIRAAPMLNQWLLMNNMEEIFGEGFITDYLKLNVCSQRPVGYEVCAAGIFGQVGGMDLEEFEPDMFYSVIGHYPTSASRTNALHLFQVANRKQFAHFDHGLKKNLIVYNSTVPALYDLNKVTMKIALFVGKNDKLAPLENVAILRNKLPNVILYHVMEREEFNHIDFIWGKHMYKYLFPHITELLDKYS